MTSYLLAGGGTAGHVNPMLAIADEIRSREPDASILMVGTREGLEARLVPERGYELATIARLPFPRRPDMRAVRFISGWRRAVRHVVALIREREVDVVVGVGGYAAAPAYAAARKTNTPLVIHEANARPGLANRLGARWTQFVGVAFPGTPLPHARFVGMPLRREIQDLDVASARSAARKKLKLALRGPVLVVTGGSLGAQRLNAAIVDALPALARAKIQVLHITGRGAATTTPRPGYLTLEYCDQMQDAFSAATLVISRAGSSTVSELSALGVPAVYVPYAVGNGEQALNARAAVDAGGAILCADADFSASFIESTVIPLLTNDAQLLEMSRASARVGERRGSELTVNLIGEALAKQNVSGA